MGFAGELSTIGLSEVFQNCAFNRLTGALTVTERGRKASVYFDAGTIRAFKAHHEKPLDYVAIALRSRAATPAALRSAMKRRRRRTLKETLREGDGFDEVRYDMAVQAAVREELILLFSWKLASFVFQEGRPDEGLFDREQLGCAVELSPQTIAVEAARRVDEWQTISEQIESERDIFLPTDELPEEAATPDALEIVRRLDGTRDLATVIEESHLGRFVILSTVAGLARAGHVGRATPVQLCELAARSEEGGEIHQAIAYLEASLEMGDGNQEVRRRLVRLYERSGRRTEAAREHKRLARLQERKGDLEGALESYGRAVELAPHETDARERIVDIHDARGNKAEFMRAGVQLAETLTSNGLLEEALEVYERLVTHEPGSVVLRESLAATHIKLHEPVKAGRELRELARLAWTEEDWDRALHYYRNVLAVDRTCEEATARIAEIEQNRSSRRRATNRRRLAVAACALLLGLTAWQGVREWFAQRALNQAARASLGGFVQRPLDDSLIDAVYVYAGICDSYPLTRGAAEAEEAVRTLLLDELHRIRVALAARPDLAERWVERLDRAPLPVQVRGIWKDERSRVIEALRK